MADRVAVMQSGEILQVGAPQEIYADPQDLRVATFIGSPRISTLTAEADPHGTLHQGGVPLPLRAPPGNLTLALRPEDLSLAAAGLPAVAEAIEFLGDSVLLHARHAVTAEAITLRLPADAPRPRIDQPIHLAFDPTRALVFGADGRRLATRVMDAAALV